MGMTGEQAYVLSKKYTEETAIGMGAIKGEKGDPGEKGFSPTITENAGNTDKIYKLDITTADSSFTTPNLKGADGTGGTGASTWSEISDKPFESLSTDFSVENGELKVVGGTGGSGEENTIESISVNGTPIPVDEHKNVNITVPDAYDDTALSNRVKTIEDDYAKSSDIPSLSGYATESYVTEQISNIPGVDLTDYATKTYVGEQITNAEHLKREIVTVLPSDTEASDNIIYMLKVESATGNDKYQEYMKIDGTVQLVGDTSVDLTDYAKIADIPTTVAELTDSADYAKIADIPTTVAELTDSSSYAKIADIPSTLPANGGNADTVNNHTVETDVPVDAKFTDTIYDDTEVKEGINEISSNLDGLGYGEIAGGKNIAKFVCWQSYENVWSSEKTYTHTLTESTNYGFKFAPITFKKDVTYTFSYKNTKEVSPTSFVIYRNNVELNAGNGWQIVKRYSNGYVEIIFTPTYDIMADRIGSWNNNTATTFTLSEPQIEIGNKRTKYVPYVMSNNQLAENVDDLKNDLGGLSFSVSGTTLSITDGGNTWTLNANS